MMDTEFPTETELLTSLVSIAKVMRALLSLRLDAVGFYSGQDELMFALSAGEPVSVSVLASALIVRPSTVSKMIGRLVDRGMVVRTQHVTDARKTMILITPAGQEACLYLTTVRRQLEGEIVRSFASKDLPAIRSTLAKVDRQLIHQLAKVR